MYAKFGLIVEAEDVFRRLLTRDVVSWHAMMTWLIEHGCFDETLNCFKMMELDDILNFPDSITFICGLRACRSKGAIDKGREMHSGIINYPYLRWIIPLVAPWLICMETVDY